jgi:hypothetical protein
MYHAPLSLPVLLTQMNSAGNRIIILRNYLASGPAIADQGKSTWKERKRAQSSECERRDPFHSGIHYTPSMP